MNKFSEIIHAEKYIGKYLLYSPSILSLLLNIENFFLKLLLAIYILHVMNAVGQEVQVYRK